VALGGIVKGEVYLNFSKVGGLEIIPQNFFGFSIPKDRILKGHFLK
jgi:hypothetical protein